MLKVVAWPVLIVAIALGVLPASQCTSISLFNRCCCTADETPGMSCCAKHAPDNSAGTSLHRKGNSGGCLLLPAQALVRNNNVALHIAHIDALPPAVAPPTLNVAVETSRHDHDNARPPDIPLFVLVRSLLI